MYRTKAGLFKFEGGESFMELCERALKCLSEIGEENDGKTVVIGTHGGVIGRLTALWSGVDISSLKRVPTVPNCSITVIRYDKGDIEVVMKGYAEHLTVSVTEEGIR